MANLTITHLKHFQFEQDAPIKILHKLVYSNYFSADRRSKSLLYLSKH